MGVRRDTAEQALTRTIESKEQKAVGNSEWNAILFDEHMLAGIPHTAGMGVTAKTTATDIVPGSILAASFLPSTRSLNYLLFLMQVVLRSCMYAVASWLQF